MSTYILSTAHMPRRAYDISHLNVLRPLRWLRQGFVDLVAMPGVSLIYGAAVAALAFVFVVLTAGGQQSFLVPFLFGGFLLIAPILSVGLLAMAKRREEERHDHGVMKILAVNAPSLSMLGLALLFLFLNWIMLSIWSSAASSMRSCPRTGRFVLCPSCSVKAGRSHWSTVASRWHWHCCSSA